MCEASSYPLFSWCLSIYTSGSQPSTHKTTHMDIRSILAAAVALAACPAALGQTPLVLQDAYIFSGPLGLEPSGLAACNGRLLFVSDKHEDTIFELKTPEGGGVVAPTPFLKLKDIPEPPPQDYPVSANMKRFIAELLGLAGGMDWEGIACDSDGNMYLASEYNFSVLKVSPAGVMEWVVDGLYAFGVKEGLFGVDNAFLEGIEIREGEIVVAVERDPRALIKVQDQEPVDVHHPVSAGKDGDGLSFDFTGLSVWNGRLFALGRNHYEVCELEWENFTVQHCATYRHVERSGEYGYQTGPYGLAEGLSVNDDSVWVILDNNGDARLAQPEDVRAQAFRFANPF